MARFVPIDAVVRVATLVAEGSITHAQASDLIGDLAGPDDGAPEPSPEELRTSIERACRQVGYQPPEGRHA